MRILLAIDGSDFSQRAVDFLLAHRGIAGEAPEITCLYVETPTALRAVGALGLDPGLPALPPVDPEKITAPFLQRLAQGGLPATLMVREGDAGLEIAQAADDGGYDLIVMGTHGRGLLKRVALGSTSNKVLANCKVPVLLVR